MLFWKVTVYFINRYFFDFLSPFFYFREPVGGMKSAKKNSNNFSAADALNGHIVVHQGATTMLTVQWQIPDIFGHNQNGIGRILKIKNQTMKIKSNFVFNLNVQINLQYNF